MMPLAVSRYGSAKPQARYEGNMTAKDIVAELKKFGTEKTKQMWLKHGAQEAVPGRPGRGHERKSRSASRWTTRSRSTFYDTGIATRCTSPV